MFTKPSPRDAQKIVEEQVHKWELSRKKGEIAGQVATWPLITVSREFGTLGAAMGKATAERLGFSFWDQELVHVIAEETGAQETLLASLDEKTRSVVDDFISESLIGAEGTATEYVRQVARVVRTIEKHGAGVIIGRGAQFILAPEAALRVRVVCPLAMRMPRFAERRELDEREADKIVRQVERERHKFIRRHYGREVGDPSHYDLVINTGWMSIEAGAEIIVSAYKARFGRLPNLT